MMTPYEEESRYVILPYLKVTNMCMLAVTCSYPKPQF